MDNVSYFTTGIAVAVVSVSWWYMTRRRRQSRTGHLVLNPNPASLAEYTRDFERFKKSGVIDGQVKEQSINNMYCLSTSLGMDVLLALGVHPPAIHQPFFEIVSDCIVFKGFIGEGRGTYPERKYSDKVLTVIWDSRNCEDAFIRVSYEIKCVDFQSIREC